MKAGSFPGLQIDSPLVSRSHANFVPTDWPPPKSFPVVLDSNGAVLSRFGDAIWDLSPWANIVLKLNFGRGRKKSGHHLNEANADVLRLIAGWWLWGPNAVRKPRSLVGRFETLKPLFAACSSAGISASDLYRFPRVIEAAATTIAPSKRLEALSYLNQIWLARDEIGFTILDEAGLRLFSKFAEERQPVQTAYIPPRIWTYQVLRLRECLDDFLANRQKVEDCYQFCLDVYATNAAGTAAAEYRSTLKHSRLPFVGRYPAGLVRNGCSFHGPFRHTAERFGIDGLLDKWVNTNERSGIRALTSYLSLISRVGIGYVISFSLMRIDECNMLRSGCYRAEPDELSETIHLIVGETTKTIEDTDACWIVSPSVKIAIDAMSSVTQMRVNAARRDPRLTVSEKELANPRLQIRAFEPWASLSRKNAFRKRDVAYTDVMRAWPKLLDPEQLRITQEDLELANRMTFGLDPERFAVGKIWPLAWHQLRRTGAVNMLASGLVSDASLQYQLKHASRAMSRYYGQNYYHLIANLDQETRGLYLREMYRSVLREFQELDSESVRSPYGEKRKRQILAPISDRDHRTLLRDVKGGDITYRENFLGGCAKLGPPCELGGISNLSGCMGHGSYKPCQNLLVKRDRRSVVLALKQSIAQQVARAPADSPQQSSLKAQLESLERALEVIDDTD